MAEGAPLLREYGLKLIEGSNPSLSAKQKRVLERGPFFVCKSGGFDSSRPFDKFTSK